jgi:cytochrome c553
VTPRLVAAVMVALALVTASRVGADGDLVAAGARWWRESPDPAYPVACATCHDDAEAAGAWAPSFPKVRPLPPPHARVMTLLQACAEAVSLHYRLPDPRPVATAIAAYLTALGADRPITPGLAAGQPAFPGRLARLRASVARGERVLSRRCGRCHRPAATARALAVFPRVREGRVESIEGFLENHHPHARDPRLHWNGQPMADLVAALMARLGGQPLVGPAIAGREGDP